MNTFKKAFAPVIMLSSTCKGVAAAPGRGGAEPPGAGTERNGHRGAQSGEETRQGFGVQEWADGSRYEGEFVNGLKHGKGKYTWGSGEVINTIKNLAKDIIRAFFFPLYVS